MQKKLSDEMENFDSKYKIFLENSDKIHTALESIDRLKTNCTELGDTVTKVQTTSDEMFARIMQNEECQPSATLADVKGRLSTVEKMVEKCQTDIEDQNQRGRLGTIELHKIPHEGSRDCPEDPYAIAINFIKIHFDIHVDLMDISVCHRQVIPTDKQRLGKHYIAPIYCKFVNRSLATRIMKKKHLLNNVRNIFNEKMSIKENLTYERRILLETVENNSIIASFCLK